MFKSYEMFAFIIWISLNVNIFSKVFESAREFEKLLPPQNTFEVLTEILNNPYVNKDTKIYTVEVMNKLILLDNLPLFGYEQTKRNPYVVEALKYN